MAPGRGCEPRTGDPVHGGDSPCQETCTRRDRGVWRASMHGIPNAGRLRIRVCVLEDFDEPQGACSMTGTLAFWSLFVFTGACWLPVVWIQIQQMREAKGATSIAALSEQFHGRFRVWTALGVGAFAAVIAIYFLMVAKLLSVNGA